MVYFTARNTTKVKKKLFLNFLNFFKKTLDLMILIMYNKIVLRERA